MPSNPCSGFRKSPKLHKVKKNSLCILSMRHVYHHSSPFSLDSGESLPEIIIAYDTFGSPNADRSNIIWVCHALTASSDVADWWPHTVESGKFLDPEKYFIVCANILGSCYGSTGPLSINPATGEPYYGDFPSLTMSDIVRAHSLLADHLCIDRIHALIGSSVGGFQALEWICGQPDRFDRLVLIATDAYASPWSIAINETQRMALRSDASFGQRAPEAGRAGLATARAIGLLTYRGGEGYNLTQQDLTPPDSPENRRPCTYQRYQGEKLCRRFNAYSYMNILNAFDTHDVGRHRGGLKAALGRIHIPTIVIGISTDMIFPPADMRRLAEMIPNASYVEIVSPFGHDGFLTEHQQLNHLLIPFLS